ncbi:MAG: hypothetical protein ACE5I1_13690 [bacterium]
MNRSNYKTPLIFLLIMAFLHTFVMPSGAESKKDKDKGKVRIAFLGIQFGGTPDDVEKRIYERYENLLKKQSRFIFKKPEDVRVALGSEHVDRLLNDPDSLSYQEAANLLNVDHIYSGQIADHSREESRVLLVGAFYRYDKKINLLHKFEILKYYDTIGVEFIKFDQEYVQTIVPESVQKKVLWPWLVLAGIGAVTLLTLTVVGSKFGSDEQGEGTRTEPTEN